MNKLCEPAPVTHSAALEELSVVRNSIEIRVPPWPMAGSRRYRFETRTDARMGASGTTHVYRETLSGQVRVWLYVTEFPASSLDHYVAFLLFCANLKRQPHSELNWILGTSTTLH
jgi:hypothetical protein